MNHWISCSKFTVKIETDDGGIIIKAPPMVKKFIGQHWTNLLKWATKLGGLQHVEWS